MGMGFGLFSVFFWVIFIGIACVILGIIFKGVAQWSKNNNSPVTEVEASVVDKRAHVSGGAGDSSASTSYYVTFQLQDGNRMELKVKSESYGLLSVYDQGVLTYQGTRFLNYVRYLR